MSQKRTTLTVKNIGGIDHSEIEFTPGITILTGRNATNRTSLLSALASVLGGSSANLKSDSDEGFVRLTVGNETYTRHYRRTGDGVSVEGNPYSENENLIDLFACLLESNSARRAIETEGNLREIIMQPVDMEAIQRSIRDLEEERTQISNRIRSIQDEREKSPTLEQKRQELQQKLERLDEKIAEVQEEINKSEIDPEDADEADKALEQLENLRQELSRKESRAETHRETLSALHDEREEIESNLQNVSTQHEELDEIESELDRLRERKRTLVEITNDLSAIVEFNDDLISDDGFTVPEFKSVDQEITAKLNPSTEQVECWTCGSVVARDIIRERNSEIRNIIEERHKERDEIQNRIETLRNQQSKLQAEESKEAEFERKLAEVKSDIDRREQQLNATVEEIETTQEQISEQKEIVQETEELRNSNLLEYHEQLSKLEYERGQSEQRLSEVESELAEIDRLSEEQEQLEAQREELRDELESQRTRVEDLERDAIESFNNRMEEILDLLDYKNIARVWIEWKKGAEFDSRRGGYRGGTVASFDLHIVRSTNDGTMYEDTIDTLSESERKVIGLVVALAGYLVHQVYETVPMILLDSLEAIDANRISTLIQYFSEHAEYTVAALLPEDAQGVDEDFSRVPAEMI